MDYFNIPVGNCNIDWASFSGGIYIVSEFENLLPYIFSGHYHEDCLLYRQNTYNQNLQEVKRDLDQFISNMGLSISIDDDRTVVNIHDLINLSTPLCFPYHTPWSKLK